MFKYNLFISILSFYAFVQVISSKPAMTETGLRVKKSSQPIETKHGTKDESNNGNPFASIISRLNEKINADKPGTYKNKI